MLRSTGYHLLVYLHFIAVFSDSTTAQVITSFRFTREPADTIVDPGNNLLLSCVAEYNNSQISASNSKWWRNGVALSMSQPNQPRSLTNDGLQLTNIGASPSSDVSDPGLYQCVSVAPVSQPNNQPQIISLPARVAVKELREFLVHPQDIIIHTSTTGYNVATFQCHVETTGDVAIRWTKDGGAVIADNTKFYIHHQYNELTELATSVLEILNPAASNTGEYSCHASNSYQETQSRTARLTVSSNTNVDLTKPFKTVQPSNTEVKVDETVQLYCGHTNYDVVRWLKDGLLISTRSRRSALTLTIETVKESDGGHYTCEAVNNEERTWSGANIVVNVPPRITQGPVDTISYTGGDTELTCQVEGKPEPTITWYRNAEKIVGSGYYVINGTSLRIVSLLKTDSGYIQCMAENQAGRAHAVAHLVVINYQSNVIGTLAAAQNAKPRKPTNFRATDTGSTSITLRWDAQGDASLWEVAAWPELDSPEQRRTRLHNTTQTTYSLQNLIPDTLYTVTLTAYNIHGHSMPKQDPVLQIETYATHQADYKKIEISTNVINSTAILVNWTIPSLANLQSHKIFYRDNLTQERITLTISEIDSNTAILSPLRAYTSYSIYVQSWNSTDKIAQSETITAMTFSDKPSAPPRDFTLRVTGTQSILVNWSLPPQTQINGQLAGYRIKWKAANRFVRTKSQILSASSLSFELTPLEGGTEYDIKIAALTQNGTGVWSAWKKAKTDELPLDETRPPGKVQFVDMIAFSDRFIITWQPNTPNDNILVRQFKLGWGLVTPDENWITLNGDKHIFTIRDLASSKIYVVQVIALNQYGESDPRLQQDTTKPHGDDQLLPPVEVTAVAVSESEMVVRWYDSQLGNIQRNLEPERRYYTIQYAKRTEANELPVYMYKNSSELGASIEGLETYTEYTFSIKVSLKPDTHSFYSLVVRNKTLEGKPAGPPVDVSVLPSSAQVDYVLLSWNNPTVLNGRIMVYRIYYSSTTKAPLNQWNFKDMRAGEVVSSGDNSRLSYEFGPVDSQYYFRVSAFTGAGESPISDMVSNLRAPAVVNSSGNPIRHSKNKDRGGPEYESSKSTEVAPVESSDLPGYLWYILGGVGGVLIMILIIIIVVVYKRKNNKKYPKSRTPNTQADLWVNQQQQHLELKSQHSTHAGSEDLDEHCSMMHSQLDVSVSMAGDITPTPYNADDSRYTTLGRNRPVIISASNQPYREAMPRAAVPPLVTADPSRPLYPKTQFSGGPQPQYGSTPRVHVGDTSQPSSDFHQFAQASQPTISQVGNTTPVVQPPQYNSPYGVPVSRAHVPRHIVKPQATVTSYKPNITVNPLSGASTTGSMHAAMPNTNNPNSMSRSRYGNSPVNTLTCNNQSVPKTPARNQLSPEPEEQLKNSLMTQSTEQLSEEMAHLDCIMQDLNAIKNDFEMT